MKLQKLYTSDYNLLIVQDLWQTRFQIFLQEFIKLNVNTDMMIKNVKLVGLNTKIVSAALNIKTLKMV